MSRLFDGSTGYLLSPASAKYDLPQTVTIAFWARWNNLAGATTQIAFNRGDGDRTNHHDCTVLLAINAPRTAYFWEFWRNNGSNATPPGVDLVTATWHHVLAWTDGVDQKVFVNGKLYAQLLASMGVADTTFGANSRLMFAVATTSFFDGELAELGVWNVALTPNEIVRLSQGSAPSRIRPTSLVSYIPVGAKDEVSLANPGVAWTISGSSTPQLTPPTLSLGEAYPLGSKL